MREAGRQRRKRKEKAGRQRKRPGAGESRACHTSLHHEWRTIPHPIPLLHLPILHSLSPAPNSPFSSRNSPPHHHVIAHSAPPRGIQQYLTLLHPCPPPTHGSLPPHHLNSSATRADAAEVKADSSAGVHAGSRRSYPVRGTISRIRWIVLYNQVD